MSKTFNIRLWFGLGSFGLIAIICAVSTFFLERFVSNTLLLREGEVSQEFLESIIRAEGQLAFAPQKMGHDPANEALQSFTKHIISIPGVFRANLHSPDQTILWSTEPSLIGKRFDINPELSRALKGELVTEIGSIHNDSKLEHVAIAADASGHFIEAYIPIRSPDNNARVLGVVELYKLPVELNKLLAQGKRIIWTSAICAALVLFFGLYWIVQRAAQLIESQQARLSRLKAFSVLGQMAGAVAHSLRNPMANIRSSAELWSAGCHAEGREIAIEVIEQIDRMDQYVRDLLTYVRTETFDLKPVDPRHVVEAAVSRFALVLRRQSIELSVKDQRPREVQVLADAALLQQALASLLSNAVEAMPSGGDLMIAIGGRSDSKMLAIEVTDTGVGIPDHIRNNIKDEYFTTKTHGLGLGLALAAGITERMGGELSLKSDVGKGTTATLMLPVGPK